MTLDEIQQYTEITSKIFTILAICVGGVWTYYNFFYRRTYVDRINIHIEGKHINVQNAEFLSIKFTAHNVGLTRFMISKDGCGLIVNSCPGLSYFLDERHLYKAIFEHAATFAVLEAHTWIEAGETISDQCIIALPASDTLIWEAQIAIASKSQHVWMEKVIIEKSST